MSGPWVLAAWLVVAAFVASALWWIVRVTEAAYLGPRAVARLYDWGAARYDAIKDLHGHEERIDLGWPLAERLRQDLGSLHRPLVLDVATGTGRLPLTLLQEPSFRGEVIGLDLSRRMLEIAVDKHRRADLADRVTWMRHPAPPLPFADGSFHAVALLEALEFLPDRDRALSEIRRVLQPGGTLVITNRIDWQARLMPGRTDPPDRFRERLRRSGFIDVEVHAWTTLYDLAWARCPGTLHGGADPSRAWSDVLRCPECGARGDWERAATDRLRCCSCATSFARRAGIWDLAGAAA